MTKYRNALPQLEGGLYLTDGGIETTLIFHEGLDLPDFAAFHLLKTSKGEAALYKYFRTYVEIAQKFETGLILESATTAINMAKANQRWIKTMVCGVSITLINELNRFGGINLPNISGQVSET